MKVVRSDWQKSVWGDNHRFLVINCGRRAGKSTISALRMLWFASENKDSIVWYVAPNYKQAKTIMWQMMRELVPKQAIRKTNETELKIELINGSQILLKGAEDPDSLRGVRIDFAVFDEVAFFNRWEEAWKVMRPTLADSKASCWFISTPNGFNHFKEMAESTDPDWNYHHYTTYDNPHIPVEEVEAMKLEMDEDSFAQEVMGEFRKMSGLIYKEFDRNIHMVDVPDITGWTIYRSLDFGFAHKTALGYFAVNTTGTEIYMYDGLYHNRFVTSDVAEAIKIKDSGRYIQAAWADSAQPQLIEDLASAGVNFQPVVKGPDSVKKGITRVAELLRPRADTGKPTLMFNKDLDWVADEFEKYRWLENKTQGIIKEVPLKKDDDAMDMVRYFAMSYKTYNRENERLIALKNRRAVNKWSIR